MKTFSAKEFNKKPAKIYRTADKEGMVRVNNSRYPDKIFVLIAKERDMDLKIHENIEIENNG